MTVAKAWKRFLKYGRLNVVSGNECIRKDGSVNNEDWDYIIGLWEYILNSKDVRLPWL